MNDDRVRRILEVAEEPLAPAPEFGAALLDDLRDELAFGGRSRTQTTTAGVRGSVTAPRRSTRLGLLLVAAVVVGGAASVFSVAAQRREPVPPSTPDGLAAIQAAGRIRIAIRPDHPQFALGAQPVSGFDKDVAQALAASLGVSPEILVIGGNEMVGGDASGWDLGLPSVPVWSIDPQAFEVTDPYYVWRHRLVVLETSPATTAADVRDLAICAVAGDEGDAWLRGDSDGAPGTPITASLVTRVSDEACLAALADGDVVAMVTATMSDADIDVRSGVRALDGPPPEPRAVIVPRRAGATRPSTLSDAVNAAIAALRADGTLTAASQRRFGGADLTQP